MPNDTWHKHFSLFALGALLVYIYVASDVDSFLIGMFAVGYLWGAWMFNPDLDINSSSRNMWWPLKFIWGNRFYSFKHHGIMHNPILWLLPEFLVCCYSVYLTKDFSAISSSLNNWLAFSIGITINAWIHLICDLIMILMHKSKIPVIKDV